jgi:hypothetical protein
MYPAEKKISLKVLVVMWLYALVILHMRIYGQRLQNGFNQDKREKYIKKLKE